MAAVLTAAIALGVLGAVAAYRTALGDAPNVPVVPTADAIPSASASAAQEATPPAARRKVRWEPCVPPAVLEGKTCVTEVVRIVALEPSPSPLPTAPAGPASSAEPGIAQRDLARQDSEPGYDDGGGAGGDDREHADDGDHGEHADEGDDHGEDHANEGDHGEDHGEIDD